ncbi:MAG: hypothetical protein R3A80_07065 [Bdellovibrionota bacterium]
MLRIVFNNLEKSELTKVIVEERLMPIIEKFPDLRGHRLTATLSMQNSPQQAGPDLFSVRVHIHGKKYKNVILDKSAQSLYVALADICNHLLEKLNREGDKDRVKSRKKTRKFLTLNRFAVVDEP